MFAGKERDTEIEIQADAVVVASAAAAAVLSAANIDLCVLQCPHTSHTRML